MVCVATVTDDARIAEIPKLNVAALRFTEAARARITKAGGSCQTIDELIMKSPSGKFDADMCLLQFLFLFFSLSNL